MEYQHVGDYKEGDKVWFQQRDANAWFGPALVLCQQGQSVWLHSQGDIKKVAVCKVKKYKLKDRDNNSDTYKDKKKNDDQVMLEDGLAEVEVSFN